MVKDRNGVELKVGDWVKRVSLNASWSRIGDVLQIRELDCNTGSMYLSDYRAYYETQTFVKVTRHPHAEAIIAAANDMNVRVGGCSGLLVFENNSFYEREDYPVIDHTLERLKEAPKQSEIKRIEAEMRKLSDDLAKLRGDS